MKRYLIPVLVILVLLGAALLNRFIDLRYLFTGASLSVVQITARTTDAYVDATGAIEDGITQLTNSGGGVLFFGPGKYLIQRTIIIPSNITIEGVGAGGVGPTMLILGNNGDMNATGMALLSIAPGAQNVSIKDIELRSMTPGPNIYPRYDTDRIRDEDTTALRIPSQSSNIKLQNIRFVNFTYGLDAGSSDGSNPVIENVKFKSVVSEVNYWAMRVRSTNARNWDVQNFNIVEMSAGQSGVLFERTGTMSFLQLSCASTLFNALLCIDIRERSGPLRFTQAHVEGPADGFRIRTASTQPVFFDHSAIWGTVEAQSTLYTFANRMALDDPAFRFNFTGTGSQSTLYRCGDTFTNGYPNPTENYPAEPYLGLASVPPLCNFDITAYAANFSNDSLPYKSFDWIASGSSPSSAELNVRNFGAVGDGVTDDTAAFRAAMVDVGFWSASTIIVPNGTYKISDTLQLEDGITFQGETNSIISFTAPDRPLFLIRVLASDTIIKRGIDLRNLSLVSTNANIPGQTATAIDISGNRGASGDFVFSDLNITGFARGIHGHKDGTAFDAQQPQLDNYALRNLTFTNNGTAIEQSSQNISNWNVANTTIQGMKAGQKGVKIDGGGGYFTNLNCVGESSQNPAEYCVKIARVGGAGFHGITSSNTKLAFIADWAIGWTPFPLVVTNSDLRDGLYVAGKVYLLSVSNMYADGGQTTPLGSRSTFFNVYGTEDPLNVYPGNESRITSCGDSFQNTSGETSSTLTFVGLTTTPVTCQFAPVDTTAPTVVMTAPTSNSTVSGTSVTVSATANDNVGVAGVQFKLDGSNLGAEDTSAPYSVVWDSTQASNANHAITAVARDAAANSTNSTGITVTVNNVVPPTVVVAPTITPAGGSFSSSQIVTLATTTSGATIYYTLDNSSPTAASTQYTTPFSISTTLTVKAIAIKSGMTDSAISSATFTKSSTSGGGGSGGGGSGGGGTPTPIPTPTPTPTPSVILPVNVIAGQVIKFPNSPTIYLVQSTGLHPFDTWASFLAYQSQSGAVIITRDGTASTYTVSAILAKTILGQTNLPPAPSTSLPAEGVDFICSGNPTVYYSYQDKKLAYTEAVLFEVWNGKNYAKIQTFASTVCATVPDGGIVPLPQGTIVKAVGGSEIYMISGTTARPFASYEAYLRDSAGKTTYTISVSYLHTYSRGAVIN